MGTIQRILLLPLLVGYSFLYAIGFIATFVVLGLATAAASLGFVFAMVYLTLLGPIQLAASIVDHQLPTSWPWLADLAAGAGIFAVAAVLGTGISVGVVGSALLIIGWISEMRAADIFEDVGDLSPRELWRGL